MENICKTQSSIEIYKKLKKSIDQLVAELFIDGFYSNI